MNKCYTTLTLPLVVGPNACIPTLMWHLGFQEPYDPQIILKVSSLSRKFKNCNFSSFSPDHVGNSIPSQWEYLLHNPNLAPVSWA